MYDKFTDLSKVSSLDLFASRDRVSPMKVALSLLDALFFIPRSQSSLVKLITCTIVNKDVRM